jgi:putative endonuclease
MPGGFVYIISNYSRNVLYIGTTSNLVNRILQHRCETYHGFSSKYKCKYLLYYEDLASIRLAIEREKQLKNWHREWKYNLIKSVNPGLIDLTPSLIDLRELEALDKLNMQRK